MAEHYGTLPGAEEYHAARGNAAWAAAAASPDEAREAALVRATQAIDATYRARFPGTRTDGRAQDLEWPRTGATDSEGNEIPDDEVPVEIINATYEAALRELETPGSMMPDLDRGGAVKRLKAGSVEIEYADGATPGTVFSLIDGILSGLIAPAGPALWGTAARA